MFRAANLEVYQFEWIYDLIDIRQDIEHRDI